MGSSFFDARRGHRSRTDSPGRRSSLYPIVGLIVGAVACSSGTDRPPLYRGGSELTSPGLGSNAPGEVESNASETVPAPEAPADMPPSQVQPIDERPEVADAGFDPGADAADAEGTASEAGQDKEKHVPGSCHTGVVRSCTIDLGTHNGIHDCWKGKQTCIDEQWGPCVPNT